jgi:DNA-binding transcriptional ArsR family regulator
MLLAMGNAEIAAVAALVGDPARAGMLDALMDGRARPAGELARIVGIAPSTASGHLSRLRAGRLVVREVHGREHRYRLASPETAALLEALARVAPPTEIRSLRSADRAVAMRQARTCYDHLAGRVGVGITEVLVHRGALIAANNGYALTARGEALLGKLGVDVAGARLRRRSFALACLDWSERRPHLAGALGAALAERLLASGWLLRRPNDRALTVTPAGSRALYREFGIEIEQAAA